MSRRKQAKPQHVKTGGDEIRNGLRDDGVVESMRRDETSRVCHSSEATHICDKCCAEFFTWIEFNEHQKVCAGDHLVLIVKDNEGLPGPRESPVISSPVPSVVSSEMSAAESAEAGFDLGNTLVNDDSLDNVEEGPEQDEAMELELCSQDKQTTKPDPQCLDSAESSSVQMSSASSYSMPSTNVTLEILHSTRVAVAQFSQGISSCGTGGKAASAAIPVILEHLVALQQQQVQQLKLIEQICSQVAIMNKHPTQAALNPVSRSLSLAPNPFPSQEIINPSILPLSGTMPSTISGQAAVSLSSVFEKSQSPPTPTVCGKPNFRDVTCTSSSSENTAPPRSSCSSNSNISTFLPSYTGSQTNSISCTQTRNTSSPLSLGQNCLLSSSSSLPFLPQSPPSSVIFPNPLASIAATANALDPLTALMKHRKGKLPNMPLFENKPNPEEPFFKHKCRFCAKVFGSDSALQIHLRSHTGERPFKCNICGNRFSTKGNLKVHFQRHKEKYPHVQMNPYPVPEYLDNVPTSSGIPYGMSVPPEKSVSSWLDSKPVVATLPATMDLPLSSTITSIGGSYDPVIVTSSIKSSYQPAPFECLSLSPNHRGSEAHFSPVSVSPHSNRETEASNILKTEGVLLPQNCSLRPRASPITEAPTSAIPSVATTPEPSSSASPVSMSPPLSLALDETKVPAGGLLDSMQTSETSKLQQLVENIDKKITDPNQCVLCHRVLSCQSALKMHYRIHTGERPYKCKVCGRAFTTKGNLKAHIGVHRENPPVLVQHSCPICQKKFTNAVVLQQHIRMHMVGHIPDSTLVNRQQEIDGVVSVNEKNFDSLSSNSNDIDDISMEDEEEDEEIENIAGVVNSSKPLIPNCNSPKSSIIISSIAALENQMKMIDATVSSNSSLGIKSLTNGFNDSNELHANCSLSEGNVENFSGNSPNKSESAYSPSAIASPTRINVEGLTIRPNSHDPFAASVKREQSESPVSASAAAMAQEARGIQSNRLTVKEETLYSTPLQLNRERVAGQNIPSLATNTSSGQTKTEVNGHNQANNPSEGHHPQFSIHIPPTYVPVGSAGMTSLLAPVPPRRTPKQHNCNVCGKNFSSASALQIHERTHTGEKPFVCSICGRAFTTKGNLKVHMGTHMWNNTPARRGRRLSVENPMALLGGEAAKFGEMFQKDLAARAMNVDPGFWNRYATAIANSLAMKNNEISVIQNRGISQLHTLNGGMDRVSSTGSPITKTGMDLGNNRHFSMLIDDSKEIGIN